jgi:hypothetical protein
MLQDVGEPDQDRKGNATPFKRVYELLQVYAAVRFFSRMNEEVTVFSN